MGITIYSIVGNHTAYYKNTNRVNTLNLLLDKYDNIVIVENPEVIRVNEDEDILFCLTYSSFLCLSLLLDGACLRFA